jgi:hypothetical protein
MRAGIRTGPEESLSAIRARAAGELAQLPEELRGIGAAKPYPVTVAPALKELARRADESI